MHSHRLRGNWGGVIPGLATRLDLVGMRSRLFASRGRHCTGSGWKAGWEQQGGGPPLCRAVSLPPRQLSLWVPGRAQSLQPRRELCGWKLHATLNPFWKDHQPVGCRPMEGFICRKAVNQKSTCGWRMCGRSSNSSGGPAAWAASADRWALTDRGGPGLLSLKDLHGHTSAAWPLGQVSVLYKLCILHLQRRQGALGPRV